MSNDNQDGVGGVRIADDDIYLSENRFDKPKEIFQFIANLIEDEERGDAQSLLDIGCATGEFLYYLGQRFPGWRMSGIEPSASMVARAREVQPDVDFQEGSVLDESLFAEKCHDVVICNGVLSIFDDPEPAIRNLIDCTRDGGTVYIGNSINPDPIDVIVRVRRANNEDAPWEKGWNIFSRAWIERILEGSDRVTGFEWFPFPMPFALPKRPEDPMRAWTIETEDDPFQRVNGARIIRNVEIVRIGIGPGN